MRKIFRRFSKKYKVSSRRHLKRYQRFRRHPVATPLMAVVGLCLVTFGVLVLVNNHSDRFKPYTSYIVILSHDHQLQTIPTNESTVGAFLKKINLRLNPGDVVEPDSGTPISEDNFHINIYRAVPVEIVDAQQETYTYSAATTPRSIVQQAGITVYPEDDLTTKPVSNFLNTPTIGEQVVIDRATPVNLNLYGTPAAIRTHAKTVKELLATKQIKLAADDSVQPDLAASLTPNLMVFVTRKGVKIESVTQTIPTPTQIIEDDSLTFGTTALRQQGSPGQEIITYQINTQNGVEVSRMVIQTVVTLPAVPEIIARGQAVQIPSDKQAVMAQAGIAASDYPYVNYIMSNESGWCPTKVQGEVGYCPGYAPANQAILDEGVGYGIGQATPGDKMASFGADWETNPVTQLRWATSYADGRYGSWEAAYNRWFAYHNW